MKVTFMEEIEAKKAWRPGMCCRCCGSFLYEIHHQYEPKDEECWWIKCSDCGRLSPEVPTRELALSAWRAR